MKVSESTSTPPPSRAESPASPQSKSFDQVLEKKSEGRQPKKPRAQKGRKSDESDGRNMVLPGASAPTGNPLGIDAAKTAAPVGSPDMQMLEGLAHEIHVVAGADPKVEVQFHSKTLQGLNVRIEKQGDQVSIRFLTGSPDVAQLLTANTSQLSQALGAKGVQVGAVRVELAPASPQSPDSGRSPRDGQRGGRDQGQDRRQR